MTWWLKLSLTVLLFSNLSQGDSLQPFGAAKNHLIPWDDGVLPVSFDKKFSDEQKKMFLEACAEWSTVAKVRCIEGKYKGNTVHVMAKSDWGCFGLWGMGTHFAFFKHKMNLAPNCWKHRTLLHEIGHAFGLIHEHQRPDRDQFIRIEDKNLKKGFLGLSKKVNFNSEQATVYTPYDLLSIMHYARAAGSKNGKDTIIVLPPNEALQNLIGKMDFLTESDAKAMAAIYGSP